MRVWGGITGHCMRVCLAGRRLLCVTLGLLLVACAGIPAGPRLVLNVHVEGLQRGDVAHVQLHRMGPEPAARSAARGRPLLQRTTGNGPLTLDLGQLPDGAYQLRIQAPSVYLREPTGYAFLLQRAHIVQFVLDNAGAAQEQLVPGPEVGLHFQLVPPSAQDLPRCREPDRPPPAPVPGVWFPGPFGPALACQTDGVVAWLSGPPKRLPPRGPVFAG